MYDDAVTMDTNITEIPDIEPGVTPLEQFGRWFTTIHGYLSLIVCIFGITTNFINITVLARKDMRNPTNAMLSWLAVSDILTMIPYVPFVIHFYCAFSPYEVSAEKYSFSWVVYMLFLINFAATTHTISIWLGVALAVFRYVQLRSTTKGTLARKRLYTIIQRVIAFIYVASAVILIPNYLTNEIEEVTYGNQTIYTIKDLQLATNVTKPIVLANVITYAVVAKLIPCALMTIFGGSLLISLNLKGRKRRRRLSTTTNNFRRESRQAKTTRMLLVVIILFLFTELPQGLLIVLSTAVQGFYGNVYTPLGDLMDLIALTNNAINFVLYCIMSTQFRTKFLQMYFNKGASFKDVERTTLTTSFNKSTLKSTT